MYAVIATGGKQERVETGQRLNVELLGVEEGSEVSLRPVLLVDGDLVLATPAELRGATVSARVVGTAKGPKITIMKFKNKTGYRKRQGHRQKLTRIKVTGISL